MTGGAVAVGAISAAYQASRCAWDRRRFPPPGRMVDLDGRRLHLLCTGEGAPAVVVVAALGTPGLEWVGIQRQLATSTRVCVYDRAGLGWSDPAPGPRTAGRMAHELDALLAAAAIPPPYLLVGHSLGGLIVRLYAARHPQRVAGVVLADASHEDQLHRLAGLDRRYARRRFWLRAARLRLRPLGLVRLASDLGLARRPRRRARREFPADLVEAGLAVSLSSRQRRASIQELAAFARGAAEVRTEAGDLGRLPLTVITGGDRGRERAYPGWRELQAELAQLSARSRHLMAPHTGHDLHLDDPALLVRVLAELVEQYRR